MSSEKSPKPLFWPWMVTEYISISVFVDIEHLAKLPINFRFLSVASNWTICNSGPASRLDCFGESKYESNITGAHRTFSTKVLRCSWAFWPWNGYDGEELHYCKLPWLTSVLWSVTMTLKVRLEIKLTSNSDRRGRSLQLFTADLFFCLMKGLHFRYDCL